MFARTRKKPEEPDRPFYDEVGYRNRNPYLNRVKEEYPERLIHPTQAIARRGTWSKWSKQKPIHVEIGTGKGKFLTDYAVQNPDAIVIGIELKFRRFYKVAKRLSHAGATNGYMLRFDGTYLHKIFAPGEINRLFLLFSDPWWKGKVSWQGKRVFSSEFLDSAYDLLAPNGYFDIKTDHDEYFKWMLEIAGQHKFVISRQTTDLANSEYAEDNIETIFETKFREKNIKACYLRLEKQA